jgi:hypothetical protein
MDILLTKLIAIDIMNVVMVLSFVKSIVPMDWYSINGREEERNVSIHLASIAEIGLKHVCLSFDKTLALNQILFFSQLRN